MISKDTLFSTRDVARIFALTESRIRYWAQTGFINPSGSSAGRRLYTFRDLVAIRAARDLLDRGIPLQRVRRNLGALREALPDLDQPLAQLRVRSDGDRVVVSHEQGTFEPLSGQLMLDFEIAQVDEEASQVLDMAAARRTGLSAGLSPTVPVKDQQGLDLDPEHPGTAYAWFLRGCSLDSSQGREDEAVLAYKRALELDPSLAAGHTNLGNIYYRQGLREQALACYEQACSLDPDQPEAHYNLANLLEEEGDLELAIAEYRRVLALAADFRDAHFNLALALEQTGVQELAIRHWERFIELSMQNDENEGAGGETSEWIGLARTHLSRLRSQG